jgi:hypothetical protein
MARSPPPHSRRASSAAHRIEDGIANQHAACVGEYFSTLGVTMQRGRALSPGDMQHDDRSQVAVISDRYWSTALARSEQVVGQSIDLKDVRLTIVGIAAPGFVGIRSDSVADVWIPLTLQAPVGYAYNSSAYGVSADRRKPWIDQDNIAWLNIVARVERARQAEATTLLQNANARGLQRMAGTLSDPRERSSTVARTLVVNVVRPRLLRTSCAILRCAARPRRSRRRRPARHVRQHLEPVTGARDRA